MSFGKAKRFDYKTSEIDVSPADYTLPPIFGNSYSIPKCPRFQENQFKEDTSSICTRTNCSRGMQCSTPHHDEHETNVQETANKTSINLKTVKRKLASNKTLTKDPLPEKSKYGVKRLVNKFENFSNEVGFIENEQFIDDDYHSLTSSEEMRIKQYEINEIRKAFKKIQDRNGSKIPNNVANFEYIMLQKMENIENNIEQFKEEFSMLNRRMQTDQLQKHHDREVAKMQTVRNYFGNQTTMLSRNMQKEIEAIISKAIKKLGDEFEKKRQSILKNSEEKIKKLINEIYATSNRSSRQIEQLCDSTATDLGKQLTKVLSRTKIPALEFNSTKHFDIMLREVGDKFYENHECFNYENICKVLSEHLQLTHEEKDALEQDNLDMTLKYGDTQEALEAQASLIDMLHNEIESLKEHLVKKKT